MAGALIRHTPTSVPGAATISTAGLMLMLAREQPLIIDVMASLALDDYGESIPGAIALAGAGAGGSFADALQIRLDRKLRQLLGGERNRPLVALAWNAERWSAHNLALRLVALGTRSASVPRRARSMAHPRPADRGHPWPGLVEAVLIR